MIETDQKKTIFKEEMEARVSSCLSNTLLVVVLETRVLKR